MLIDIPNYGELNIENIVFDMNGTIAENGIIDEENRLTNIPVSKIINSWCLEKMRMSGIVI